MDAHASKRTSVILPTYNRVALLEKSLNAVLAQIDDRDELIVVDDGSSDGTGDFLARYANRIDTIRQANGGKAKALNEGLRRARGEFVWIVDDDDIVCPTAHGDLLHLFERDPSIDIAYGRHRRFREDGDGNIELLDTGYWNDCPPSELFVATLEDFFVHQPGMLVKRSLYGAVGGFDESLPRSIDYEMLIRLAGRGTAAATDRVIFHQRLHEGDRGPATSRMKARDRDANWVSHDARIFAKLHETLPLESYAPQRRLAEARQRRRALLQRGTIMARKKHWGLALADFDSALSESRDHLSDEEKRIIRRATGSKYGCDEAIGNPEIDRGLAALRRNHPHGRDLTRAMARGLVWRARQAVSRGKPRDASRIALQACRWMIS